jgi:hypothetical protein
MATRFNFCSGVSTLQIRSIRNARAEYSVEPARRITAVIVANSDYIDYLNVSGGFFAALVSASSTDHTTDTRGLVNI